ncbi:MAG: hypothetical protein PWQ80_1315 [Thermotoga sp.]|nr:hypothetical protein [Thermotoga sp.]MDK2950252.1 hypothetical protein [Thermotoga sp.]
MVHHARRGVGGPLYPKSAICGAELPPEALRVGKRCGSEAMKVGSYATEPCEPGQAREGAAISRCLRVPWGCPTGALRPRTPRSGDVDGGCVVHFLFGYTIVEILSLLFCFCTITLIGFLTISLVLETKARLVNDLDKALDEFYAVDFMRHEYEVKKAEIPSLSVTSSCLSFNADYKGKSGRISYVVVFNDGLYKLIRRGLSGEGNNYLLETKKKIVFLQDGKVFSVRIGGTTYDLGVSE